MSNSSKKALDIQLYVKYLAVNNCTFQWQKTILQRQILCTSAIYNQLMMDELSYTNTYGDTFWDPYSLFLSLSLSLSISLLTLYLLKSWHPLFTAHSMATVLWCLIIAVVCSLHIILYNKMQRITPKVRV